MTTATLFQWVELKQDVPNSPVKAGNKGVVLDHLSQLINSLNERFGTDFTLADQLFFEKITETVIANDSIKKAAQVNTKENFAPVLEKHLENLFIERMDGNEKIFMEVMNNEEFRAMVLEKLLSSIYETLNRNVDETGNSN
ncbi:type I restriction endonuclease subunit R [Anabaena sp. FACHB-1250]|uniref:type I restriction endonuclease subunit R n=1 Tax=Anabaena sp. FACHB-1250 TaxID=2692770 RepID=UPI001F54D87B|nr:type I restriction endonuclease subunit R [Anabaena sp. FACHB-1250]